MVCPNRGVRPAGGANGAGPVVFRVDCGNNIFFSANGDRRPPGKNNCNFNLTEEELVGFRDPGSTQSTAVVSKVHVNGWARDWSDSGAARAKLLGSGLTKRALTAAINDVDPVALKKDITEWLWAQNEVLPLWIDMLDMVVYRAQCIRGLTDAE